MNHVTLQRLEVKFFDNPACVSSNPEAFFPEKGVPVLSIAAKAVCFACNHRQECFDYALLIDDRWAIMGGVTAHDRKPIRDEHKRVVKAAAKEGLSNEQISAEYGYSIKYVERLLEERIYLNGTVDGRFCNGKDN